MFGPAAGNSLVKNTSHKVVVPFYAYAALSFLAAVVLIMFDTDVYLGYYFNPKILAVTHVMALGWGTMIIFGASHQLYPVLIEGKLRSHLLAFITFLLAGVGIPILIFAFYTFRLDWPLITGGVLINLATIVYLINLSLSRSNTKKINVHAAFAYAAALWLFITVALGLLLGINFTNHFFSKDSIYYLSLHAHMGIVGWFLMMVLGVGSRLIPMFLISKYENSKQLWWVFYLSNIGLIAFIYLFLFDANPLFYFMPLVLIAVGIVLFSNFLKHAYRARIRKRVDNQVRISILSVVLTVIPIVVLAVILILPQQKELAQAAMLYGFTIFFGWITAIILGMTFKTLPFIIWNKVYHKIAGRRKTPNPKDLFSSRVFIANSMSYLLGLVVFGSGIASANGAVLKIGAVLLIIAAFLYNLNVFKIIFHSAKKIES